MRACIYGIYIEERERASLACTAANKEVCCNRRYIYVCCNDALITCMIVGGTYMKYFAIQCYTTKQLSHSTWYIYSEIYSPKTRLLSGNVTAHKYMCAVLFRSMYIYGVLYKTQLAHGWQVCTNTVDSGYSEPVFTVPWEITITKVDCTWQCTYV